MAKVTHLTLAKEGEFAERHIYARQTDEATDAPLATIGHDLRAARLRRGEDLASVSRVLKIRQEHLEALEEDRLTALPGRTYAVGFVRAYAHYLGLEPLQAVERFKAETAGRDDTGRTAGFTEIPEEADTPYGWIAIAIVVVGLVAYGGYYLVTSPESVGKQAVAPVPAHILAKTESRPPAAKAVPNKGPRPPGEAKAVGPAPPAPPSGNGSQTNAAAPATAGQNAMQAPESAAAPPKTGHVYGFWNQNPRIVLRATQPTRILVQSGHGTVYIDHALEPGDIYRVPDRPGLRLTVQHGNAIEVDLDGQAMGLAGKTPDATQDVALDPQAIADRYHGNAE